MAQYLSPFAGRQFLDANGNPYVGALLFTYVAGSSTKVTTTKDSAGVSNHTNPIVLNARGEPSDGAGTSQAIWQPGGVAVKYVLAPSTDSDPPMSAISTWDNISGINDTSVTIDQWIAGPTPTYVSVTQFTLVGDQTNTFHVGRRIKASVTAGTVYGTITVSAYTTLTTITVVLDSGALDSGLSAVYYGILTGTNTSIPGVEIIGDDWTHQGNVTHEGTVTMVSKAINEAKGAAVASVAGTTDIWTPADGQTVHITGTNAITGFGTAPQAGAVRHVIADAAFSLTDGANLVCPGNANITCAADDAFDVYADTTTKMYVLNYTRADGTPLVIGTRTQEFTTAGTFTNGFTIPATELWVTLSAGGGGGGAEDTSGTGGGGGGAGAGMKSFYIRGLTIGAFLDVVVGAAGAGGTVPGAGAGTDGGNGGSSIVRVGGGGAAYITVTGGIGGGGQTLGVYNGGAAGTCTIAGSNGVAGEAGAAADPGNGGASIFGIGGIGQNPGTAPAATAYGAGGGGGYNGAGASAGGAGKNGAVIFHW